MRKTFTRADGKYTEKLDLSIEEKWIYVYYKHGENEKTAYILKNNQKPDEEYLRDFFEENQISEELITDAHSFLHKGKKEEKENWMKFSTFLIKAISYNLVIGIILALFIVSGYKLGAKADNMLSIYPLFTVIGVFIGIAFGAYCGYVLIRHYLMEKKEREEIVTPIFSKQKKSKEIVDPQNHIVEVSLDQVRKAIEKFTNDLPEGTYRTVLVNNDYSIDFTQLVNYLGGIPAKKFYMSKETYDIFDESDKMIPEVMDKVQKAVDLYVKEHGKQPILPYDPLRRINTYELIQNHYLETAPAFDFFITDYDGIITHLRPSYIKSQS